MVCDISSTMNFCFGAFQKGAVDKGEPTRKHGVWRCNQLHFGKRTTIDSSADKSLFFAHGSMCIPAAFHVHL
ncbi:hypothetical protein KCO_01362 [Pectobacterium brasiliense ICMP 19477]|nr:hypothetical protein KCO_01362 [Pectobacterium brasiliense ICMP 19477]